MNTTIRTIGNSRGVIIPSSFLKACNMQDMVTIECVDGSIVITPVREPRQAWFASITNEASVMDRIPLDEDTTEWEWE
jgi:antitoxin MazE